MKTGNKCPISNIKKLRLELSLTQQEVSDGSGVDIKTYRNIEKGSAQPRLDTMQALYNFFHNKRVNVSMDYLLGLSDFRTPENDYIGTQTGLSDKAINQLKILKRDKISIDTLNYILEQGDCFVFLSNINGYLHNNLTVPRYYDSSSDSYEDIEYGEDSPLSDCFLVGSPDSKGVTPINVNIVYTYLLNCIQQTLDKWRKNKKTFGMDTFTTMVSRATSSTAAAE